MEEQQQSSSSIQVNNSQKSRSAADQSTAEVRPVRKVDRWLGETLRVELVDGRVVVGRFVCTDNVPNIILVAAQEFWKCKEEEATDPSRVPTRSVGMVLIKGQHIRTIFHLPKQSSDSRAAGWRDKNGEGKDAAADGTKCGK